MLKRKMIFIILILSSLLSCSHLSNNDSDVNMLNTKNCNSDDHVEKNKNCYKICTDLHFYKKGFESEKPEIIIHRHPEFKKKTLYIGDIFDLENALQHTDKNQKKEIENLIKKDIDQLSNNLKENYIRGNHELYACQNCPPYKIINGILFTHGHCFCWDKDKVTYWESGKKEKKGCYNCESDCFEKAVKFAEKCNKIHTIVFGHTHEKNLENIEIERTKDGQTVKELITIINLKKGCSYLEIPNPYMSQSNEEDSEECNPCK